MFTSNEVAVGKPSDADRLQAADRDSRDAATTCQDGVAKSLSQKGFDRLTPFGFEGSDPFWDRL
jgi:hypothetical protein